MLKFVTSKHGRRGRWEEVLRYIFGLGKRLERGQG